MAVHIDRCYCFGKTFAELKAVAAEAGAETVEEVQAHIVFGHNCKLCHPYVRRMLRTGDTVFHEIVTGEDEPPGTAGSRGETCRSLRP